MLGTGIMDNLTVLQKADMALADMTAGGGILQPEQARKFIRLLIKKASLLPLISVVPMQAQKKLLEKLRFGQRILRAGTEAAPLPLADRSKPDFSKVELDAKLFKAEVRIDNETLEDNIERGTFKQTVMDLMAERLALDLEEVFIQSDTANGALPVVLQQLDGILKQASSHVVDATLQTTNKTLFRDMLRTMPSEYLRNKKAMAILTSVDSLIDFKDTLSDRATVYGDEALKNEIQAIYSGVPIYDIPNMPENLGVGLNTTNMLLLDPKNINAGIWRNIRLETDKLVSDGVYIIVASVRADVKYTEEDAVVKTINVKVA